MHIRKLLLLLFVVAISISKYGIAREGRGIRDRKGETDIHSHMKEEHRTGEGGLARKGPLTPDEYKELRRKHQTASDQKQKRKD